MWGDWSPDCAGRVEVLWRWPDARRGRWYSSLCFLTGPGSNNRSGDARTWKVTREGCWG